MEVKPGFKRTEVGVIPDDWEAGRLTAIADVRDGTHDSPRYTNAGVPFVTSKNIVSGKISFEDITFISGEDAREVNKRSKVDRNDILLSMIGTVGNSALVDFEPDFCIKNVALIKPNSSKADSRFLIQLLRSNQYVRYIAKKLEGGIQKFVSLGVLRSLDVLLPPTKAEQAAIAEALSDADALVDSLEQLLTKKCQLKQGAMHDLLTGKTRLPGFERKSGFKQTEVGVIPEDWNHSPFGNLYAEPSRNGIYKTSRFKGRGTRIVNMGEMFGYEFISDQDMSRVELTINELSSSGLQDGDLLFGRRSVVPAGAGKCSLVVSLSEPITFESSIIRVRLDKTEAQPRFYYYFFGSSIGRSAVSTIVSGTNVKGIRATELRELKVPQPIKSEQDAIATALSDMDAEIAALESKLAKARDIKQGMMQELLTGRIRLV